jgi:hypothetical protein
MRNVKSAIAQLQTNNPVTALSAISVRQPPMRVNLGLGLYSEGLSRRDSAQVAQYEVLGNEAKRHVRPVSVRDDRNGRLLVSHAAQRLPAFVDRPVPPSSS